MKRLIVKPTPHSMPMPYIDPQLMPSGISVNFNLIAIQHMPNTPICLPKKRPKVMPRGTPCMTCSRPTPARLMPALAKAKIGRIAKATSVWRSCSHSCNGRALGSVLSRIGMNRARITPVRVA